MTAIQTLPRPAILDDGTIRSVMAPADSILAAADDVARTLGTSSSGVILTAFLEAAAHGLGLDGLGCYLHCSNRSDVDRQRSITRLKNLTVFTYSSSGSGFGSAVRAVFRDSLRAFRHAQSPGELLLPRLGMTLDNAPFVHFNDVRSVIAADDEPTSPVPAAESGAATSPDKPVLTGTSPGNIYPSSAVLSLSVGAFVGASRRPFLSLETNLLRMDGISLLVERMNRVLAAAATVPPAADRVSRVP
jgi:hypothetical protein